jgi:NAD(P)-dependent dehydrogenase (short-subunit alcohol dehydrogenase family)
VYGLSRFPVTLYKEQWDKLLSMAGEIKAFIAEHDGPVDTPGLSGLAQTEEHKQALYAQLASDVPLGRLGQPEEIAKAAVFLASEDASFIAGIELFVDGGTVQV